MAKPVAIGLSLCNLAGMGFNCGIVGLPNAGKSTIFNAVTAQHVPAESYPFCTTGHNTGIVAVPDDRLDRITAIFRPERTVPATVEFVDIAGLVKNAHSGEGLGNKFLHFIGEVDAIAHVVRCFDNNNVAHIEGGINPAHDIGIVETELMLSDLDKVHRQIDKVKKSAATGDKHAKEIFEPMDKARQALETGTPLRRAGLKEDELAKLHPLFLLTAKPVLYVANGNETDIKSPSERIRAVERIAKNEGAECITICGGIEAELSDISPGERREFLQDLGLSETGLVRLVHAGYRLLNLISFFTKEGPEVRAWTVRNGTKAPQAAGKIHTDFEKGFIKADVFSFDDLVKFGSLHAVHEKGRVRSEGHDYTIKDGDIVQFKFNA